MSLVGWKNMWYGNYTMMEYISQKYNSEDIIINTRIDILDNCNANFYNYTNMMTFIKNSITVYYTNKCKLTKNIFLYNNEWVGIDNIFFGNIYTMQKLIKHFQFNLDEIVDSYEEGKFKFPHELLFFRENEKIF
jgi:hypothetical protein